MIEVDIQVPYIGKVYDFNLNENVPIASIVAEVATMICASERWPLQTSENRLGLFCPVRMRQLMPSRTLRDEGIITGQSLILC